MGFSVTMAGIIVIGLLFMTALSIVAMELTVGKSVIEGIKLRGKNEWEKIASLMSIKTASVLPDNQTIIFVFSNNGSLAYNDFSRFDLIVNYYSVDDGRRITVPLTFGIGWNITRIIVNGGYYEPYSQGASILPSMSAEVYAHLPTTSDPSIPIKIVFVNNYGGKATYVFVGG